MTPSLHQQAKEVFSEVYDLPTVQREQRLAEYALQSPELVNEVRSLLQFHTGGSVVIAEPHVPKVRTRSTLSTTFQSRTGRLLGFVLRSLAVAVPIILAGVAIGHWTSGRLQTALKSSIANRLSEQIDYRLNQFIDWERSQIEKAESWCQKPSVQEKLLELVSNFSGMDRNGSAPVDLNTHREAMIDSIRQSLRAAAGERVDFALWDQRMVTVTDSGIGLQPERLDTLVNPAVAQILAPAIRGQSKMFLPRLGSIGWEDAGLGHQQPQLSLVLALRDDDGEIVGAMMLRTESIERGFKELIELWNRSPGFSETYLISERGVLMTRSRYADLLDQLELPLVKTLRTSSDATPVTDAATSDPDRSTAKTDFPTLAYPSVDSGINILVRDPGVNLLEGRQSSYNPTAWPPTLMALQVTAGNNGLSVDGYRNYVGQPVVGAWRWIPRFSVGLAIEENFDDAFELASTVQRAIWGLTAIFATTTATISLIPLVRSLPGSLRDISDVGPYQVQELLGQGGMGRVYLAEHALLCRQSAVKVLSGPDIDLSAISRFEREVQLASQLTHPNTIAIYDFGRNKEGLFYYAMEYIHGAHLGQLIEYTGPIHPGRCIYILSQLCRALSEAHHVGVVHRDIKPQNVMVCNRGGEPDFVKLFDYGLVKAFAPGVTPTASQTKIVVGTPRFMAPERLSSPWLADPRVDIYSIGALAYYLLTTKLPPLFTLTADNLNEHPGIETLDLPASAVKFGDLLGNCLSPEPGNRPSNMKSLLDALEELSEQFPWSRQDSVVWWAKHELKLLQLVKSKRQKLVASLAAERK